MTKFILTLYFNSDYVQPQWLVNEQRTLSHIITLTNLDICINYIDDFGGACAPNQAHHAFQTLQSLLSELGLMDSPKKESLPVTRLVFYGLLYDTVKMTVRVPEDKLSEIVSLVELWLSMRTATIKDLQSLLGKLSYVCTCICPGRIVMQRLLSVLRSNYNQDSFQITSDFRSDLNWYFFSCQSLMVFLCYQSLIGSPMPTIFE